MPVSRCNSIIASTCGSNVREHRIDQSLGDRFDRIHFLGVRLGIAEPGNAPQRLDKARLD
jgi:hypothetical protein